MLRTGRRGVAPTTDREDTTTMLLTAWMLIGLFVDGYAHTNIIEDGEDFFTPWHAIFYAGFLATAVWIGIVARRRQQPDRSAIEWLPPGYGLGAVGVLLFAVGGLGDGIWHQTLGVETGIDALLSPTHLVLFVGGILIITSPLRARWARDTDPAPSLRRFAVPLTALAIATNLVAFFFVYFWTLAHEGAMLTRYIPESEFGAEDVARSISGALVTTIVLIVPIALAARRWRPPFGSFTALFLIVNLAIVVTFDADWVAVPAALAGGLTADLVLQWRGGWPTRVRLACLAAPLAMWSVYVLVVGFTNDIVWQPELWGGLILFGGLAGLTMALLAFPPEVPAAASTY